MVAYSCCAIASPTRSREAAVTTLMVAMDAARSTGVVAATVACSCYDTASEAACALTGGGGVGVARSIGATMASMVL
jgi:hypothetical protein